MRAWADFYELKDFIEEAMKSGCENFSIIFQMLFLHILNNSFQIYTVK